MNDREKIETVIRDWEYGARFGVVVPSMLMLLQGLILKFGDRVTIDGTCDALDAAIRTAERLKNSLRKAQ